MSHYDTIGFTGITSKETLSALINQVSPHAQMIGDYAVYRDASGAALWIGINQDNEFFSAEPYFSGCLQSVWVSHVAANQYDDGFDDGTGFAHVWQNGSEEGDGDYPFIVDILDIASFPQTTVGTAQKIAVCAFAESAELFADEAAFAASQEAQEMKWAAQCFIPSGMFLSENAPEGARPAARALFTGIVRKAEKRRNAVTHSPFYYCEIATYGGVVVGGLPCRSLCRYAANRQCDTGRILANGAACRCARASNLSQTRLLAKTDRQIVFNLRIALRYTPLYPNQRFGQRGKAASTAYKTQY